MSGRRKLTNYSLLVILAIPYLIPAGLASFSFFSAISKIKYVSILYILILIAKDRRVKKNTLVTSTVIFCLALIGITIYKGTDILGSVKMSADMLFPLLWAGKMLNMNEKKFLKFLTSYYTFIAILNLLLIFIFPNGIVQTSAVNAVNLLGDDNKMIFTLLCGLAISLYYNGLYEKDRKKIRLKIFYCVIYLSALWTIWAVTGLVVMLLAILMWFFDNHTRLAKRVFTLRNIIIAAAVLFYLVVFSDFFESGFFADFMLNVLHKNANFSARTTLWTQAIAKIAASPVWGYGYGIDTVYDFSFTGAQGVLGGFSCHNGYLRLLLEGGVVLLVFYAMIYWRLSNTIRNIWKNNRSVHILVFCTAGILVACLFEAEYTGFLYFVVLGIINNSKLRVVNDGVK